MEPRIKMWIGLGVVASVIGNAGVSAQSAETRSILMAQATTDNGEGGGEGGGEAPTTYALSSTDTNAYNYDAKSQVAAYGDLVRDGYARAAAAALELDKAVDVLLAGPNEGSLVKARKAWVEARPAYLRTEAFRFYDGPIEQVEGFINAWPMNEAHIDYVEGKADAGIINDAKADLGIEALRNKNQADDEANVSTGWHAIEFLLWGQDISAVGPGNRPYTDYIAGSSSNDRRRIYLKTITEGLLVDLKGLAADWDGTKADSYGTKFAAFDQREALGRMVNGIAILAGFEFMSERLAVALDSGDQEDEHSCFSDTTKQDFVYDLEGIKQVWTGDSFGVSRPGLDELVRAQDVGLADQIDKLLADAEAKVAVLGDPWDQVLASPKGSPERKSAEDVVAALQALGDGFKTVGTRLGVLVLIPTG